MLYLMSLNPSSKDGAGPPADALCGAWSPPRREAAAVSPACRELIECGQGESLPEDHTGTFSRAATHELPYFLKI